MINRHFLNMIIQILEAREQNDHYEADKIFEQAVIDLLSRKRMKECIARGQVEALIRAFQYPEIKANEIR